MLAPWPVIVEQTTIARYFASRYDKKYPKVATRKMLRNFIHEAVDNQFLSVDDELRLGKNQPEED